jgi:hydrogenase maturation protein HypF
LDELQTCQRWEEQRLALGKLMGTEPALIAHDLHPDYYTSRWAARVSLPTIAVQHHHAHIAAGMLEQGWLDHEVLGVAWDGTGFGLDGTIWGGEFLLATASGFRRVCRLRPFPLPGGEAAIREPWRVAIVLLAAALGQDEAIRLLAERGLAADSLGKMLHLATRPGLSPLTSSIGRLFDAVATITLPCEQTSGGRAQYEGQLAMQLESACQRPAAADNGAYALPLIAGDPAELDWRPLIAAVVADCRAGTAPATIALRFHTALADAVGTVAARHPELPIVLGGGVFQNRVLTELIARRFADRHQRLGLPGLIPPGDGGLAAGQLIVALASAPSP